MNLIDLQLDSELMEQLDANMVLRALGDKWLRIYVYGML